MDWLNYHHLYYFWTIVRTGGVTQASAELRLAPPTLSAQVRSLEGSLGEKLLQRSGRHVVPTETGRLVFRYADEIFSLGKEMIDTVRYPPSRRPSRLVIGLADVLPKLIARQLIEPALHLGEPVRIVCREASPEQLLARLAINELDLVLTDAPMDPNLKVRAYNHLLGESGISFVGTAKLANAIGRRFPQSLNGAPILLPTDNTSVRRALDQWFNSLGIQPVVVGEFEDDALLRVFGEKSTGIFPTPSVLEGQLRQRYGLRLIGRTKEVRVRVYAISVEKNIKHPAVVAICDTARRELFA